MTARTSMLATMAGVGAAAFLALAFVQSSVPAFYGYDGPYHLGYSDWIRHHGVSREFPWWQETFLAHHWADKDFLYHLLLIPFTLGDLAGGGKAASLVFGSLLYIGIAGALFLLRVRAPMLWGAVCLAGSVTLLYRAGLVRSHVVAIPIAALGTAAILTRRPVASALAAAAYAWTHIAWHLLPAVAVLHLIAQAALGERPRWRVGWAVILGTLTAVLLNPFVPNNLTLWWVQNVEVLAMSWSPSSPDLGLGLEILPDSPWTLLGANPGPALLTLAGSLLAARALRRRGGIAASGAAAVATLGVVTWGFLAMSLLSRRFAEFWAPFSVLFAAVAASREGALPALPPGPARRILIAAAVILIAATGWSTIARAQRIVAEDPGMVFEPCARWIDAHVPEGATVFHTDWDEFPELFFFAPRQRYLVGLDPTFMYVTDPSRWALWRNIAEGRAPAMRDAITMTFGSHHVVADAGYTAFLERADQEPGMRLMLADDDCRVYEIDEPGTGSAAGYRISTWSVEGGGEIDAGPDDFVDPARGGAAGSCARLSGGFVWPISAEASFHLVSDDEVRVEINGAPGVDTAAPAPAPSLDQVIDRSRAGSWHPIERRFETRLNPGYNAVSVTDCRKGTVWGFHLEVLPQ
jgi:hypothetical protein